MSTPLTTLIALIAPLTLTALLAPVPAAAASTIEERPPAPSIGDLDGDGVFTADDLAILRSILAGAPTNLPKSVLDIDQNGRIDHWDLEMLRNWVERSTPDPIDDYPEPSVVPGDVDGDGVVTEADLIQMMEIVQGLAKPRNGFASADVDGDGRITLNDLIVLVDRFYGPAPSEVS